MITHKLPGWTILSASWNPNHYWLLLYTTLPQIFGKLVHHGRDEALHGAELGVEAKEEQHEEEAAGPEGGERHLENSAGVGQESEAGAWDRMVLWEASWPNDLLFVSGV